MQNLIGPAVVGNLPTPIVGFTTFNTSAGVVTFDLVSLSPGYGTLAGCASNAIGNICTPTGSPITLTQVTANSVSITLNLTGIAYLGSSSTGSSPTTALFTTQNVIPGTITAILAQAFSTTGFQSSYGAVYSSTTAPSTCQTNPLQSLLGTWTYETSGFFGQTLPFASAGIFTAALSPVAGSLTGIVIFTNTISMGGYITGETAYTGTYSVLSNCSGGTITFNLSANRMQFNFYFEKGGTEIVLVSEDLGDTVIGRAKLGPASPCPSNPLQALSGSWTFSLSGFVPGLVPYAAAGYFTASIKNGTQGVLTITDTVNRGGDIGGATAGNGIYTITPGCTGGTLFIYGTSTPQNFNFYFVNGDTELYLISGDGGVTVYGEANKM
jgi:hypothetical protein